MKIVFICGSLEPGRDGVGDYARRLAAELTEIGHEASLISLYDHGAKQIISETQVSQQHSLTVLRIPASERQTVRYKAADEWIVKANPDWISLQFVPFAFHIKGLPFSLAGMVKKLAHGRHLHVMFHELWVGMEKGSDKKQIIWGGIQKKIIQALLRKLRPSVVHTQTKIYQHQLHRIGRDALILPLFSNIVKTSAGPFTEETNKQEITFVVFGSIHPGAPIESFAREVAAFEKTSGYKMAFSFIGRSGREKVNWISTLQSQGLAVNDKGELAEATISDNLTTASFGISSTPYALIEKSGTVAAMLEHNLPVICVAKPWQPRSITFEKNSATEVVEYQEGNLATLVVKNRRSRNKKVSLSVCSQFVAHLEQAETNKPQD